MQKILLLALTCTLFYSSFARADIPATRQTVLRGDKAEAKWKDLDPAANATAGCSNCRTEEQVGCNGVTVTERKFAANRTTCADREPIIESGFKVGSRYKCTDTVELGYTHSHANVFRSAVNSIKGMFQRSADLCRE